MAQMYNWLECHIALSLQPKLEELKIFMSSTEYRIIIHGFFTNEQNRRLYIYVKTSKKIVASFHPPGKFDSKSIFFLKRHQNGIITEDNIAEEIQVFDCLCKPLNQLRLETREIYLPLLYNNSSSYKASGYGEDKLLNILHSLMYLADIGQGLHKGYVVLALPSLDVLFKAVMDPKKFLVVKYVLETTVLSWISEIKNVLRHDCAADLFSNFGEEPTPNEEVKMWEFHLTHLKSLLTQLNSPMVQYVIQSLQQIGSQYTNSISYMKREINKEINESSRILSNFYPLWKWYNRIFLSTKLHNTLRLLKPLMTTLSLIWSNSTHYHLQSRFNLVIQILCNGMVKYASIMIRKNILDEPEKSHQELKKSLQICASFRGTYLDVKAEIDFVNAKNINRFKDKRSKIKNIQNQLFDKSFEKTEEDPKNEKFNVNEEDLLIQNSPWPHWNSPCFQTLNNFMERCNDLLELVETVQHFQTLSNVAEVGGIGNIGIDLLVNDISVTYTNAIEEFFAAISDLMNIKEMESFDFNYFKLRSTVKTLEVKLSNILYQTLKECRSVQSKTRLLKVFQATCSRPKIQSALSDVTKNLAKEYWVDVCHLETRFEIHQEKPPRHPTFSNEASQIIWIYNLMDKIQSSMSNMKSVCANILEGEEGWKIKEYYSDIITKLSRYKSEATESWLLKLKKQNFSKLKETLLVAEDFDDTIQERPLFLNITVSNDFLKVIHEMLYFSQDPFLICQQKDIDNLVGDISVVDLNISIKKLQFITFGYNNIMEKIKDLEKPLFESKLVDIDQLIEQGLEKFTWKMKESFDFIESAMSLIYTDVFQSLEILQNNCKDILGITDSWTQSCFEFPFNHLPLSIKELLEMKSQFLQSFAEMLILSNNKIHSLVASSAQVLNVSEETPCWQDYLCSMDFIILTGLKKNICSHLRILYSHIEKNSTKGLFPLLRLNVILIDREVDFYPYLDQITYHQSIQEIIQQWIKDIFKKSDLLTMLSGKQSFLELLEKDTEVEELVTRINRGVAETVAKCRNGVQTFEEFSHLWFDGRDDLLNFQENTYSEMAKQNYGEKSWSIERKKYPENRLLSHKDVDESKQISGNKSHQLTLKSLEVFGVEAEKYMNLKERILKVADYEDIGWVRVNQEPINQTNNLIVSKWLWKSTKILMSQLILNLQELDQYIKELESNLEFVSKRKKDIFSFTKIMRIFIQVSGAHSQMGKDFDLISKTVEFLRKYNHELPENANLLFLSTPTRWNNLKTKVSLAKQNLGLTIQEDSQSILKELNGFNRRLSNLLKDISEISLTKHDCDPAYAIHIICESNLNFIALDNEAKDLKELEDLLEISVLKIDNLNKCHTQLKRLEDIWRVVRFINKNHSEWKACLWQKINVTSLKAEIKKELTILEEISGESHNWDVFKSISTSVKNMLIGVSLIEHLRNPAMRTRHWRHILRMIKSPVDFEFLNQLNLQQFLELDFQSSIEGVHLIVQKAVKELVVEKALKTCEEVWLSYIFHLEIRKLPTNEFDFKQEECLSSQMYREERDTTPSTTRSNSTNRDHQIYLPPSRLSTSGEEVLSVAMLKDTEDLFEDLINHQITLDSLLQCQQTTSFDDEIAKWQGQLLIIESIIILWLQVQEKWNQLIEAFAVPEIQTLLPNEAKKFSKANFHFCRLMKSVERNPNILQNCTKKWIQPCLESLLTVFKKCYTSLLNQVGYYRTKFPRFYFLPAKEILELIYHGRNFNALNFHLRKLFHHIWHLEFQRPEETSVPTIIGIRSKTKEFLPLQKPIKCEGPVENWLVLLESFLKDSLCHELSSILCDTKVSILSYFDPEETNHIHHDDTLKNLYKNWKWLINTPTEILILSSKIELTQQILLAMKGNLNEQKEKLKEYWTNINSSLIGISKILQSIARKNRNQETIDFQESGPLLNGTEFSSDIEIIPLVTTQQLAKLETLMLRQSLSNCLINELLVLCKESNGNAKMDFFWKKQLKYFFDNKSKQVTINCLSWEFDYGYEYQGSAKRELITLNTDKGFLGLLHSLISFKTGHCIGPLDGQKLETVTELGLCLGKALFLVNCGVHQDRTFWEDILKGVILTENWLCLNNINHLKKDQIHVLAKELEKFFELMKNTKLLKTESGAMRPSKHFGGGIFTLQYSDFRMKPYDPDKLNIYPVIHAKLPNTLLRQLRPVSCLMPCFHQAVQILLSSFGFTYTDKLSIQLVEFVKNIEKLGSLDRISLIHSMDSFSNEQNLSSNLIRLQNILSEAFKLLAMYKDTENKNFDEKPELLYQFEMKAVANAICSFWLPVLKESGIYVAKKLIDHLWPGLIHNSKKRSVDNHEIIPREPSRVDCSNQNLDGLINAAIENLKLGSSSSFRLKLKQFYFLTQTNRLILVLGPPGCGKSTIIHTFENIMKQKGFYTILKNLFLKSQESFELTGYTDPETREWNEGLLANILNNLCKRMNERDEEMYFIKLDGKADVKQFEALQNIFLDNTEIKELGNCERFFLPQNLKFFWELEEIKDLNPSFVSQVGIFQMTSFDISWHVLWKFWLQNQPEKSQEYLGLLGEKYLNRLMDCCFPCCYNPSSHLNNESKVLFSSKWIVQQTTFNIISTLCSFWQSLKNCAQPESFRDFEFCFCFSCVWAFGGCLMKDQQKIFDLWWKETFSESQIFPDNRTVFDFRLDYSSEKIKFLPWTKQPSGHQFVLENKSSDFIPTEKTEQLSYLLDLLIDVQMPLILIGSDGCGKTKILSEKLKTLCSNEMADIKSLLIHANRFTTAMSLQQRLSEYTEWKYGSIYMPKGGKRLYCCMDDIHLSNVDEYGDQSALELIRQHLDLGGFYDSKSKKWRNMKDIVYIGTLNPNPTADIPNLSGRLLRHFALIATPYPDLSELTTIFRGILSQNMIERGKWTITESNNLNEDKDLKTIIEKIIYCTAELHLKLRTMFLPTPTRSHYIFTINGIKSIFKNFCLSVRLDSEQEALQLWQHECSWEFQHKMINEVDDHRYQVAFKTSVRKIFSNKMHIAFLSEKQDDVFSNLIETESGRVIAYTTSYSESLTSQPNKLDIDHYQPIKDHISLQHLLTKSMEEYNKNNCSLKIPLYKSSMKIICRYARLLSGNTCGHYTVLTKGCPGSFLPLLRLSGFLSGYTLIQLQKNVPNEITDEQIPFIKNQLISFCMRAGLKDEKIILHINEDVCSDDILALLLEFICHGSFKMLISSEQQNNIINIIRGEVSHTGEIFSTQNAWLYFLQRVNSNLRIFIIIGDSHHNYERWCRQFPSIVKNTNFVWICHWTKKQLIENALYHLQDLKWISMKQKENTCHLLSLMHTSLERLTSKDGRPLFKYCNNTTYQNFVLRFIYLVGLRYQSVMSDHENALNAYDYTHQVEQESKNVTHTIEHETLLLAQNKSTSKLLRHQIGQDSTIAKQQQNFVDLQLKTIGKLYKLLSGYQVAHRRAVFKTVQIIINTKKLLHKLNLEDLTRLRSIQTPILEVEDVLATIIIIVKSPSTDLTWHKGAKRIMANFDRFLNDLMTFDDYALSKSALELIEEYTKKPTFKPAHVAQVNPASGILCQWVINVLRYHQIMNNKVKPLHEKMKITIAEIRKADNHLETKKNRSKEVTTRLAQLSQNFEEASISTRRHEIMLDYSQKYLSNSTEIQLMIKEEKETLKKAIKLLDHRIDAVRGICAIAAGLVTYLGPCQHTLRQYILTVMWPSFLNEKGINLIYDQIHPLKGYVIEWSFVQETPNNSLKNNEELTSDLKTEIIQEKEKIDDKQKCFQDDSNYKIVFSSINSQTETQNNQKSELSEKLIEDGTIESKFINSTTEIDQNCLQRKGKSQSAEEKEEIIKTDCFKEVDSWSGFEDGSFTENMQGWQPTLNSDDYKLYLYSVVKILVGEDKLNEWIRDDINDQHLVNLAILCSSQDRNFFLVDPNFYGENYFKELTRQQLQEEAKILDLNNFDSNFSEDLQKFIEQGQNVILRNYSGFLDHNIQFLLCHKSSKDSNPNSFPTNCFTDGCFPPGKNSQLCVTSQSEKFNLSIDVASQTTILNYQFCMKALTESLHTRIFQKLCPFLASELVKARKNQEIIHNHLHQAKNYVFAFMASTPPKENTVKNSISILSKWYQMRQKEIDLQDRIILVIKHLTEKKQELKDLAIRAAILYQLMDSFQHVQPCYYFPLSEFLDRIDEILQLLYENLDSVNDSKTDETYSELKVPYTSANLQNSTKILKTEDPFQFPKLPNFPTPGIDYTYLSANRIRLLVETLTHRILQMVQISLHENDWLLFQTMFLLTTRINNNEFTSWEEFSLLVQGNPGISIQLTLQDFQCDEKPPTWLPSSCWDNVLALSILNGPLDNLCVQLVENSHIWQIWFQSEKPEFESFPFDIYSEQGIFSEFHQLLIIRNLRLDRFLNSIELFLKKNSLYSFDPIKLFDILQFGNPYYGYMVSIPLREHEDPTTDLLQAMTPQEQLQQLAQENNISFKLMQISPSGEKNNFEKLKSEIQEEFTWIIINFTEFLPDEFLQQLSQYLDKQFWNKPHTVKKNSSLKSCLWLIHTVSDNIPKCIYKHFAKVASYHLGGIIVNPENVSYNLPIPAGSLWTTILKYLHQASKFVKEKYGEVIPLQKLLIYGVIVAHSILITLQNFGCSSGFSQWHPFHHPQLLPWTLEAVMQISLNQKNKEHLFESLKTISEFFHGHFVWLSNDESHVKLVFNQVLHSIVYNPGRNIFIFGSEVIPVPPANIELTDYANWLQRKSNLLDSLKVLQIPPKISKNIDLLRNKIFFNRMNTVYVHLTMEDNLLSQLPDMNFEENLQTALELCRDELPRLLDLQNLNLDYWRLSQNSEEFQNSINKIPMSSYVLIQECIHFNDLLDRIHDEVKELKIRLIRGIKAINSRQLTIAKSLKNFQVPVSWLHQGWVASCYTLTSWIKGMKRLYRQLEIFCNQLRICPTSFQNGISLWLGGICNPIAFITALKMDMAFKHNSFLQNISLKLEKMTSTTEKFHPPVFVFHDVYLSGASWDEKQNYILQSSNSIRHFTSMAVQIKQNEEIVEDLNSETNIYKCPIYTNPSRLVHVCSVEIICPVPVKEWLHKPVAIFLNPGIFEEDDIYQDFYPEIGFFAQKDTKMKTQQQSENDDNVHLKCEPFESTIGMEEASLERSNSKDFNEKEDVPTSTDWDDGYAKRRRETIEKKEKVFSVDMNKKKNISLKEFQLRENMTASLENADFSSRCKSIDKMADMKLNDEKMEKLKDGKDEIFEIEEKSGENDDEEEAFVVRERKEGNIIKEHEKELSKEEKREIEKKETEKENEKKVEKVELKEKRMSLEEREKEKVENGLLSEEKKRKILKEENEEEKEKEMEFCGDEKEEKMEIRKNWGEGKTKGNRGEEKKEETNEKNVDVKREEKDEGENNNKNNIDEVKRDVEKKNNNKRDEENQDGEGENKNENKDAKEKDDEVKNNRNDEEKIGIEALNVNKNDEDKEKVIDGMNNNKNNNDEEENHSKLL